jgi:NitT/TauT family transport system permease protein
MRFWNIFSPNKTISSEIDYGIVFAQIVFVLGIWALFPIPMIPKLSQVVASFGMLWKEGILVELYASFIVFLKALVYTVLISLSLSYLTVVPFFRPVAEAVGKLRFLGIMGLTLPFTILTGGGEALKIAILTFGMTVYFVTTMANEVASIPREEFDHARTIRMKEWRVVLEVVILGKMDRAFEVTRQIAAMGWMMVTLVEGLVRSGGGVGAVIISYNKQFDKLPSVFAILVIIVLTGILQDAGIKMMMNKTCRWASLSLERR